jgi:hypothetical protein
VLVVRSGPAGPLGPPSQVRTGHRQHDIRRRNVAKRGSLGKYTSEVRAFNAAGADPTPATKSFTII